MYMSLHYIRVSCFSDTFTIVSSRKTGWVLWLMHQQISDSDLVNEFESFMV